MDEYSRILIERYCMSHNSAKSRRLFELVWLSEGTDADAIFLEKAIRNEKDSELKAALEDLDSYIFGY